MARMRRSRKSDYFTCSGYLFAFRSDLVKEFSRGIPEDAFIPFIVRKKGFKLVYIPEAKVYVSYPKNIKDWLKQKNRIIKAYHNMYKIKIDGERIPKMKSAKNEILEGSWIALSYPKNIKEFTYTLILFPFRLLAWLQSFLDFYIINKRHTDSWERIRSTK